MANTEPEFYNFSNHDYALPTRGSMVISAANIVPNIVFTIQDGTITINGNGHVDYDASKLDEVSVQFWEAINRAWPNFLQKETK